MCSGVEVRIGDRTSKIYYQTAMAALPVKLPGAGALEWIIWGRRKGEAGSSPQGGWARLSTIDLGTWEVLQPIRAQAIVERFMQNQGSAGLRGRRLSQWIEVPLGMAIECLVVGEGQNRRAYVITTTPPPKYKWARDHWPLLGEVEEWLAQEAP